MQTPYKIKLPIYTGKHLNINITDTGKGNHRRWQATGEQREQRANSAGRFRHGSPRSYTSRVNPSTSLQTPYKIKLPIYTGKHLNINITDTGKGNYRRWQATGGQREQRANSAGRFRHDSPRKYTSRVNPSTSLQNAVKNKVHRLHRKTSEYQHYRYRQGQLSALASHRRTARATSEFRRTVSTWLH